MPPKNAQQRLPFLPIGSRDRASSPTESSVLSTLPSEQFEDIEDPIIRPQSAPPIRRRKRGRGPSKPRLRTSWIYDHMPDEDRETQYFNTVNGRLE